MRGAWPILLFVLVLPSCKKEAPSPVPAPVVAVSPAPLQPALPQPVPQGTPIPSIVERADPSPSTFALRCPSGATVAGALPPEGTEAWCQLESGKRHGPIVAFFPAGGKRMQGEYRDGAEHGVWQEYFDGGSLRSEKIYERGRATGRWSTYRHDGTIASELVQVSDIEQHLTEYRPDGSRLRAGPLRGGQRQGSWTEWNDGGYPNDVVYEKDERVGSKRSGDEIGIPECDDYIERYSQCVADKVPEAARESMQEALDQTRKAWRDAATGPARKALATACKAARDAAASATRSMGCEW